MNDQNFGDPFSSSGILDGTGPAANKPVGLLSSLPENIPEQPGRLPQSSPDSPLAHVYDTLDDLILQEIPASGEASVFPAPLLDKAESESLRTRYNEIQAKFVDNPRLAVREADALVSEVVEKITRMFAEEHSTLDSQWNQGGQVSTEDLRMALQRYRAFFNRLVV